MQADSSPIFRMVFMMFFFIVIINILLETFSLSSSAKSEDESRISTKIAVTQASHFESDTSPNAVRWL